MSKTRLKAWKLLLGSLALTLAVGTAPGSASAADSAFIQKMTEQYEAFESKHQSAYSQYLKDERHLYDTYRKQMTAVYDDLLKKAHDDLDYLTDTINRDIEQLKKSYKENSEAFRHYVRVSDKDRAGYAMDLYEDTMDPDYAGSPMDRFEDSLDPDSAGDPMDLYGDELDPDTAGSAIDLYEDEVDPHSAGSVMDRFEDESSIHSAGSVMDRYEDGDLSKSEAEKLMAQALAQAEADMSKRIEATRKTVTLRKNVSLQDIRDAWLNAKKSILQQREKTIAEVSAARKALTGTGIEFKPLVLGDWITVVIDGDFMIFEQPPFIDGGSTLVPMRAIFEKLGADVKWNAKDRSVAASKGDTTIWLQIGNRSAKIQGKAQTLEAAPRMTNGSTMVPLRFVGEALGEDVKWDSELRTITIDSENN